MEIMGFPVFRGRESSAVDGVGSSNCWPGCTGVVYSLYLRIKLTLTAMMSYSAVSFFANRYGRKPVILSILAMFLSSLVALLAAEMTSGLVNIILLAIWIILHVSSGSPTLVLATNMYVIDLVQPQHRHVPLFPFFIVYFHADVLSRTAALSKITGWTVLGVLHMFEAN